MSSKARGGLSKREFKAAGGTIAKKQAGKTSGSGDDGISSQYKALMKKYESSLKPSKTETKAQKSLDTLTSAHEAGMTAKSGEAIPMGLITGAQAQMTKQYVDQAGVYQRTIAEEQAKRGAASDVLSAESSLLEKEMSIQAAQQEKSQTLQDEMALAAYKKGLTGGGGSGKVTLQQVKKTKKDAFGGSTTVYGTFNPKTGEYNWDE